jgi:HlyD family secretion protein
MFTRTPFLKTLKRENRFGEPRKMRVFTWFVTLLVAFSAGVAGVNLAKPKLIPEEYRIHIERHFTAYLAPAFSYVSATFWGTPNSETPKYLLAAVDRGNIVNTVTASGTLSAITTVQVSSQVSGEMLRIHADYNAELKQGDVIAELDPLSFQIEVEKAQSDLNVAEAAVTIQKSLYDKTLADLASTKSEAESAHFGSERQRVALAEAKRDLKRKRSLVGTISQVELQKAENAVDLAAQSLNGAEADERTRQSLVTAAESTLKSAEAQVVHANAQVEQKKASLKEARVQLERTKIRSPVDGVVIGRTIEEGQQVAVTLQTQTLFTVAQDLREMQINISVDEADIGKIRKGQPVIYTVDSFSGREFRAEVKQVRKDPQILQNVVTYVVIANAPNPDKILMPGMTANARIVIDSRENVQKVPVAALRFAPEGVTAPSQSHIWTLDEEQRLQAVPVTIGLSDGRMVAVMSERPVRQVVVGVDQSAAPPTLVRRIIGSI